MTDTAASQETPATGAGGIIRFDWLRSSAFWLGVALPVGLIVVLVPMMSAYWVKTMTSAAVAALAAASAGFLYSRLGLVSLAQWALVGVGGWVGLRTMYAFDWPFELSLLSGGVVAAIMGVLVGLPALRVRGLYLALITLMAAGAFHIFVTVNGFPDGGPGFIGKVFSGQRQFMPRPALAESDQAYFVYTFVIVMICIGLIQLHLWTRPGRAWALIRRGEPAAMSAGISILGYQNWAFALAGFISGIGGCLLAGSVGQMDGRGFNASESILIFTLTVVGGAYSWIGALITGLLYRAFPALLEDWGVDGDLALIFFGAALIHGIMTAPMGIAGQLQDLVGLVRAKITGRPRGGEDA